MKTISLRQGKDQSLRRYHPWVFSGAIAKSDDSLQEGELVRVLSAEGEFMGIGHYQIGSIAVRILTFTDEPIDQSFWSRRLAAAYALRQSLSVMRDDNDMYRLVHGEGDQLPGLVIDIYGPAAVMQAHSVGMHLQRKEIAAALHALMPQLQCIYYKSDTTLPYKAALTDESGFLLGKPMELVAQENGLRFHIDWLKGQKTGFFLDQRDNRALVEHYAQGRRVLNMFCYTGGFSVYALRGGAELVHSVDSSERAVEVTDRNVALNFPNCTRHHSFATDAFKFLSTENKPQTSDIIHHTSDISPQPSYDLIVLDPPAFAKHRDALHNALKGYTRLNAKAMQKIAPGGILFTFSCSQAVNKDQFRLAVFTAAAQTGRFVRILHQLHQPEDHPINIYHPEGEYLKGLVLQIE